MIEEFEQLEPNDCVSTCRPNHVRVETPWRHASDRVCARIGAALHTLDHQFSKSARNEKTSSADGNPTPCGGHEPRGSAAYTSATVRRLPPPRVKPSAGA